MYVFKSSGASLSPIYEYTKYTLWYGIWLDTYAILLLLKSNIKLLLMHNDIYSKQEIEEYSFKRGLSHQIMKIELVSISAAESSFLYIL